MADPSDDLGIPTKPPVRPASSGMASMAAAPPPSPAGRAPNMPPRAPDLGRPELPRAPAAAPARPPETGNAVAAAARRSEVDTRKLLVGKEITLSGEINSCDKLIIEGSVEANLSNCRDIDIAETGLFKGSASIEDAEIRGRFEGNLTVRKRLLIKATGHVSGTIRYGQIEIECGGQISGDIQSQPVIEDGLNGAETNARATI